MYTREIKIFENKQPTTSTNRQSSRADHYKRHEKWFPLLHRIAAVVSQHRQTSPPPYLTGIETKDHQVLSTTSCRRRCRGVSPKKHYDAVKLIVIVDGTYALHARVRSLLDIRFAVVGGVHFSLLSKVQYDIGDSCSLDNLIDSIFSLFRKHIEPELHHAHN
nr:hypothetical protein [Tanacetum cinerariifolium]